MSCAARARRLDERADITVLERGDFVSVANCGLPYFVGGEITNEKALILQTRASLKAWLNLDVRPRHDVRVIDRAQRTVTAMTPSGPQTFPYDALVLAPGAQALRPPLPGLDSPRVTTLRTVPDASALRDKVLGGAGRAVVLGAGFVGLEAAEALANRGLEVTVVELFDHVLPLLETELAQLIAEEMAQLGIQVVPGIGAAAIEQAADYDTVVLADGTRLDADIVILSVGVRPDTAFAEAAGIVCDRGAIVIDEHGQTNDPHIWAVGDAVVSTHQVTGIGRPIPLAGPANRAGRLVADAILRPDSARPLPRLIGTAIVRVGRLTAALTGANRAALRTSGIPHHTLHLHAGDHASYFPGAESMHLVVHFGTDGRLLGAQGVGAAGIDKRIDVLGAALKAGLSVDDLIDLDLAYAPPYSAAKDPIMMAGLMGDNVQTGVLRLWHADEVDAVMASALVLDVRTRAEFATGHLPGALNIPHTELRGRLDEVRTSAVGRPVRVLCAAGLRSYIAHRILGAAGFDSASLSGGNQTLRAWLAAQGRADLLTAQSGT
jgi:NADPH-dependent 2,4-dienoyl-CoA reductase/sulfur reductase-like enzyme/rhodanese-related sulfurtransferase